MTITALTAAAPIMGPVYDHAKPETRQAWLDFRRAGITATQVRDWRNGSKRRAIIAEKVTGHTEDLSHVAAINHGNLREPAIGDWVNQKFGLTPTGAVFSHPENTRYLASPDGITVDFSGQISVGTPDTALLEIKTSAHDLTPGPVDAHRVLVHVTPGSKFDQSGYYAQMQWQMFVMNAATTLFVWETRTDMIDPETGTYIPDGPPQYAWVPRDQAVIDVLVPMADDALAVIDQARLGATGQVVPEGSGLDPEHAVIVSDYLTALEDEKAATARKTAAWKTLQGHYIGGDDQSIDGGFALVTTSTTTKTKRAFDEDAARAAHPEAMAAYDRIVAEFTVVTTEDVQGLTVRRKKN